MTGNKTKVNIVDEIMPPITTVAKGRCTSAVPVAKAIGIKPSEATNAVINTGRSRSTAPFKLRHEHQGCS